MQKTKVINIITRLDTGGSSELALQVTKGLNHDKFNSILVYGHNPSADYNTCNVSCIYISHLKRDISPFNDIIALIRVLFLFIREKPGIVQTNSSKAGFIGRWAAWLYNLIAKAKGEKPANIVHMPHGHVFYGYGFSRAKTALFLFLERISAKITDKLIAITSGEKNESLNLRVGKTPQWTIIHPAVECAEIDPLRYRDTIRHELGISLHTVVVGTVARFEIVKGIIYLIEAAGLVFKHSPDNVRYLLVGDGSQRNIVESTARTLGIYDKIIFTGMSENVAQLMSAMDIFVQPSLNEGMGKTLVQAHSLGLPIIATKVQGIPDIVIEGKSGFLVPPADAAQLADKILMLVKNPALRLQMGKTGKNWVTRKEEGLSCFSEERAIKQFENLYDSLIRTH